MRIFKLCILLCLICIPIALPAQDNSKYFEGAVPVVDGKVTFSTTIQAKGMDHTQIYESVLAWANKFFQPKENLSPKVLYSNPEKGEIIAGGEDYIVFQENFLVLDRTRIYYHLIVKCEDEKCNLTMTRIHYWYEEDIDGGYKYKAEKWITDKEALNKAKNKFAKVSGKFRKETIDYKDRMFSEIQSALNGQVAVAITPKVETTKVQPTVTKVIPEKKSDKPEEAIKNAVRMTITAGNDEQFEINRESWGGFGEIFGKRVTFCLMDTQKKTLNMLMEQSNTYKITFYNSDNQPALTINCKKLMIQNINGEEAQKMSKDCVVDKSYNMYVGEIIE